MNDDINVIQLIQNRLKNNKLDIFDLLGLYGYIMFCKDLFKKNEELNLFIKDIFGLEFPQYIVKSRTLMAARVNKYIYYMKQNELKDLLINTKKYFNENGINDLENNKIKEKRKNKNENDKLDAWLKGL